MPRLNNHQQANLVRKKSERSDKYYTPKTLVKIHLELLMPIVPAGSLILEPARGQGAYYDYFQLAFPTCSYDYCEIDEGKDFLQYSIGNSPEVIITNPPFSLLQKFIDKSIELRPLIISFLLNQYAVTPCRIRDFNNAGYFVVGYLITRVNRWFGCSVILTVSRNATENIIQFDCVKHILEG